VHLIAEEEDPLGRVVEGGVGARRGDEGDVAAGGREDAFQRLDERGSYLWNLVDLDDADHNDPALAEGLRGETGRGFANFRDVRAAGPAGEESREERRRHGGTLTRYHHRGDRPARRDDSLAWQRLAAA
jgi:hypothetical protein